MYIRESNKAWHPQDHKHGFIDLVHLQNFRKTNISYPLISTCTCAYQWVRNVSFLENSANALNKRFLCTIQTTRVANINTH